MAPLNMHVVAGEQVFSEIPFLAARPPLHGPFLLGCIVVVCMGFVRFLDLRRILLNAYASFICPQSVDCTQDKKPEEW